MKKIEIEATFFEIEEWERNNPAISGLVYNNQIQLKYVAEVSQEKEKLKCDVSYYAFKPEEAIVGWADKWGDLPQQIKDFAAGVGVSGKNFTTAGGKEKVKQAIRENSPELVTLGESKWTDDSISFKNALQQAIPKIILIPAVKDVADELKIQKTGKSAFSELMNKLVLPKIKNEENYIAITTAIAAFSEKIHSKDGIGSIEEINTKLSDKLKRMINTKATIRLSDPEIETLLSSNIGLRIHDGDHDTPVGLQGHGMQRTLIFTLLELVAENDTLINAANTRTTILLFEEPELYLHPQMLRKLKATLNTIAESPTWQVVCSTHSPVFINVADYPQSLAILSKTVSNRIHVKQLKIDPFEDTEGGRIERDALRAALNFHPTVCEAFFAEGVTLVEGDTEMAILKHCDELLEYCNVDLGKSLDCTIVSCGGKWTIPAIARLLRAFNIEFKVVHDLDRQGKSDEELGELKAIHPYNANKRIAIHCQPDKTWINEDTLEDVWGGKKNDKPYGAITTLRELVTTVSVPEKLVKMVQFVYQDFLSVEVAEAKATEADALS